MFAERNRIARYGIAIVFLLLWTASGCLVPNPKQISAELDAAVELWNPNR